MKFRGNEISEHGKQFGLVDYAAFTKGLNLVYVGEDIFNELDFVLEGGEVYDEEGEPIMFCQYYITDSFGADVLSMNNETILYCDYLNIYVWAVSHWGTSWEYVLTGIPVPEEV